MNTNDKNEYNQVKLPLRIAMEVVLQGIKIRLGRSIVTITGVICGIAFLMSILTGQMIKNGVKKEDAIREEVTRINNFVKAEVGFLNNKTISLVVAGKLSEIELRTLESFEKEKIKTIQIDKNTQIDKNLKSIKKVSEKEFSGEESTALFLMGAGKIPDRKWKVLLAKHHPKILATTISHAKINNISENQLIELSRIWSQDETYKKLQKEQQDKFKNIWIGIISLLVTVIGIMNAMLMSVTERFREIGTMKCLGALSGFIKHIFLIESSLMGIAGGFSGVIIGAVFSIFAYSFSYGFSLVWTSINFLKLGEYGLACLLIGIILSILAALYPARIASKMVPADALRSNL